MTNEKLFEVLGDIDEKYVEGAKKTMKEKKIINFKTWGGMAACLCMVVLGTTLFGNFSTSNPNPEYVQVVSPILEVSSAEEMSEYLDFDVPVLDKAVKAYIVMVIDGYPRSARIEYADNSTFNMEYGTGDISGIHGGTFDREETINGVKISFYHYYSEVTNEDFRYALWETDGFTYSLTGTDHIEEEIQYLTK
ncbi:MAG: hypothetical protein ACI4AQ_00245 [Lachnospiraceae bacterium]